MLSKTERKTFNDVVVPVDTAVVETPPGVDVAATKLARTDQTVAAAAATCWSAHKTYKDYATAGNVLYTWWQGLEWCGSGGSITSWRVYDRGGETSTPGWNYTGHGIKALCLEDSGRPGRLGADANGGDRPLPHAGFDGAGHT